MNDSVEWKRVVVWAFLIFVSAQIVSICSVVTMHWEIYGDSVDEAARNAKLVRRLGVASVAFCLYLAFFRRTAKAMLLHAVSIFVLIQLIDIAVVFALTRSSDGLLDLPGTGRSLLVCMLAYAAAVLRPPRLR